MVRCLTLALVALGISSCSRKAAVVDNSTQEAHAPIAQPIPVISDSNSTPMLAPTTAADLDVVLAQLTREVRKWIVRHQRPPQDFEEFAASAPSPIPPAPAGKKFALGKQMRVIVVKR